MGHSGLWDKGGIRHSVDWMGWEGFSKVNGSVIPCGSFMILWFQVLGMIPATMAG